MKITILSDEPMSPNLAARDPGTACAYVQTTTTANGDLYCLYRRGSTKHGPDGVLVVQRSSDGGKTWSEPLTVFDRTAQDPPDSVICGGVCALGNTLLADLCSVEMLDPDVYVFSDQGETFPRHIRLFRSEDGGRTWSGEVEIPMGSFAKRTGVASSPFPLGDGSLCIPLEVQTHAGPQGTAACFSDDSGLTMSAPRLLAADDAAALSLCDARFTRLRDGAYLMHLWAFRYDTEETISVHQSLSTDGGRTWSKPAPTAIQGQISQPLQLGSGAVIAVANHRQTPEGNQLWWSVDGAATWNDAPIQMWDVAAERMLGHPAAARIDQQDEQVWDALPAFSFGTPALELLDDATVLLSYYAIVDGVTHVRACRFRAEQD